MKIMKDKSGGKYCLNFGPNKNYDPSFYPHLGSKKSRPPISFGLYSLSILEQLVLHSNLNRWRWLLLLRWYLFLIKFDFDMFLQNINNKCKYYSSRYYSFYSNPTKISKILPVPI